MIDNGYSIINAEISKGNTANINALEKRGYAVVDQTENTFFYEKDISDLNESNYSRK